MKLLYLFGLIIFGFTTHAGNKTSSVPIANAGPDQTIYLTQTSNVTLNGSASFGDSFHWADVSTDYKSGATITSPNSMVTGITALKQGVWYFQLSVTIGSVTVKDIVVVRVNYNLPPANSTLVHFFDMSDPSNYLVINNRTDTTTWFPVSNQTLSQSGTTPNKVLLFRDRSNGIMIDSLRGKTVNMIEDGYGGESNDGGATHYARSEFSITQSNFTLDTAKTYVIEWQCYFPQEEYYINLDSRNWSNIVCMFQIHGNDASSPPFCMTLNYHGNIAFNVLRPDGTKDSLTIGQYADFYNNAHTIRVTLREGKGYPGQDGFVKVELDGVQKYYLNTGNLGAVAFQDYLKFGTLYDFGRRIVDPNLLSRGRKFKLVTNYFNVYTLSNTVVNTAPTSNAGTDQIITLPANNITLSGTGKDSDGSIASYQWTKISGPTSGSIVNPNSATTTVSNLVAGLYQFELKVTDNQGATGKATVQITVNSAPNSSPTANAGTDQTLTLPVNSVTISGSGVDSDGTIASYQWTKISGPTSGSIVNPNSATTAVGNLVAGLYQFELKVTDNQGATGKATMQITVNSAPNSSPTANAGTDQTITLPVNSVKLSGSGTDSDGTIASYKWSKISGASAVISDSTSAAATVNGLIQGIYTFQLTVKDNSGSIGKDTVQVKVNAAEQVDTVKVTAPVNIAPTANAGTDQTITLPVNSVKLLGSAVDSDGTIASYKWSKISGGSAVISDSTSAAATVNGLIQGIYTFQLTIKDNDGSIGKDTVQVKVNAAEQVDTVKVTAPVNIAPTVNAGTDQTITLPVNSVKLSGSAVDSDGTIASYKWSKISGGSAAISDSTSAAATVNGLIQGIYTFELAVKDNSGSIGKDTVQVKVNAAEQVDTVKVTAPVNIAPTANAGTDQTITLPVNSVTLSGNGLDPDGIIASFKWTKISGPSSITMKKPNSALVTVSNLDRGVYEFELSVTDKNGTVGKDTVEIKVNAADESNTVKETVSVNIAPTANAGTDQTITLPVNSVKLSGSGTDSDGTIASYKWSKISGASAVISDSTSAAATVNGLIQGIYTFELAVKDNSGSIGKDTVQVKVNAAEQVDTVKVTAPVNIAPTANAGTDKTITLPTNSSQIVGTGTDSDGNVVGYSWTKIAGPSTFSIANSSSAVTNISGLVEGTYQFVLKVTDDKGATGKDTIQVKVNAAIPANIAPTANAGTDQTITLPVNSVKLSGSAVDSDGTIASYKWSKISGGSAVISDSTSAVATVNGLIQGIYTFELAVKDNSGSIGKDTVQVKVNAAEQVDTVKVTAPVNIAPTANAGTDQTITLPVNSVKLSGSAVDSDGTIASYKWSKISGGSAVISDSTSAAATVNGLIQGIYTFQLAVKDNDGSIGKDTVQVKVNAAEQVDTVKVTAPVNIAPTANAGTDKTITLPTNSLQIVGTGTDSDGNVVAYSWTKIAGPSTFSITNSSSAVTNISGLVEGTYQFVLQVTDDKGATGKDTVQVKVNAAIPANIAPTANAGTDQTITLPVNSVKLSGSGTDSDGTIASYKWSKISGGSAVISDSTSAAATVNGLIQGIYIFQLTVKDNSGAIAKDTIKVTVNNATVSTSPVNIAPIVDAGSDITSVLSNQSVTLNGKATDQDGEIMSFVWSQVSGPSASTILTSNSASTEITDLKEGTYAYELKVVDDKGAVSRDTMKVTIALERIAPQTVNQESNLKVYPNPVVDVANVAITTAQSNTNVTVTITNISGKTVFSKDFVSVSNSVLQQVDMSNLIKGVYIVTVYFDGMQKQSVKVVKL